MRAFRACPAPDTDSRQLAADRFRVAGNPDSAVEGEKKSDAAVFCANRLENIRFFTDLWDKLPMLTVELAAELAELTAELTAE